MIAFYKAIIPGALFAWILSMVLMNGGTTGGALYVHKMTIGDISFAWSWLAFVGGTALTWFILYSLE